YFDSAMLTGADFTGAEVRGASFSYTASNGFTLVQLYSTASYRAMDLSGINLSLNNLAAANFTGQNLSNASFNSATLTGADFRQANLTKALVYGATLTGADFTDAEVRGANFTKDYSQATGITLAQLYSTASYKVKDLS